jgi:hypothetical protein
MCGEACAVRPGRLDASHAGETVQTPRGRVAVHAGAAAVDQDRPASTRSDGPVNGPPGCWWQRDQDHLGALAAHPEYPVAVFLAEIGYVCAGSFEDPQAQQAGHCYQREVARMG